MGYINEMVKKLLFKEDSFIVWRFHGEEGIRIQNELTGIVHELVGA